MLVMVVFFIAFRWIHLSTPLIRLFLLVLILLLMPTLNFLPLYCGESSFSLLLCRESFSKLRPRSGHVGKMLTREVIRKSAPLARDGGWLCRRAAEVYSPAPRRIARQSPCRFAAPVRDS